MSTEPKAIPNAGKAGFVVFPVWLPERHAGSTTTAIASGFPRRKFQPAARQITLISAVDGSVALSEGEV